MVRTNGRGWEGEEIKRKGRKGEWWRLCIVRTCFCFYIPGENTHNTASGALGCGWYLSPVSVLPVLPVLPGKKHPRTNGNYGAIPAFDPR
jgi:hypothetical protein